jgi:hypothetical protein
MTTTSNAAPISQAIETVSLAGPIYEKLKKDGMVQRLESMSRDVEKERERLRGAVGMGIDVDTGTKPGVSTFTGASIPPHTYRPPTRTIHNPLMRSNFLSTLSNPSIPLSKLSRNVPHGIKGEGMLELVWKNKVGVDRVGWFVGVIGGLEVQAGRRGMSTSVTNGASPSTSLRVSTYTAEEAYTTEFTKTFFHWIKKHLDEVVPSSTSAMNTSITSSVVPSRSKNSSLPSNVDIKDAKSGISIGDCLLDDEERRAGWIEKWEYM